MDNGWMDKAAVACLAFREGLQQQPMHQGPVYQHYVSHYMAQMCSAVKHFSYLTVKYWCYIIAMHSSFSRMRVINHNSVLSGDRIRQCETSSGALEDKNYSFCYSEGMKWTVYWWKLPRFLAVWKQNYFLQLCRSMSCKQHSIIYLYLSYFTNDNVVYWILCSKYHMLITMNYASFTWNLLSVISVQL